MRRAAHIMAVILALCSIPLGAQEGWIVLRGKVSSGRQVVPYATLQLQGTSVGTACNDAGEYELKVAVGHEADTVLVRSLGYLPTRLTVSALLRDGDVKLRSQAVSLREVRVSAFRSPQHLLMAAVERIDSNYHQRTSWSTWFLRDWRALDGELYLFDEAVMLMMRRGYSRYADKRGYTYDPTHREMASNYKSLLRHRLMIYDREQLGRKVKDPEGVDLMMEYMDNEEFYDPVSAPQASFALSHGTLAQHRFEPIMEYEDDGEVYYLLRAVGKGRVAKAPVSYTYTVRRSDLAIVAVTTAMTKIRMRADDEAWINVDLNWMEYVEDSSSWTYDVRDGAYTLTHYYNARTVDLGNGTRWQFVPEQRWQQCVEWTMTDFSTEAVATDAEVLDVKPKTLAGAFGRSDYSSDFWGRYNSVPIDTMPLRLLEEKVSIINKQR